MHTPWAYLPEFPDKPASRFALNPETKQPMENKEYVKVSKKFQIHDPDLKKF